MSIISRDIDSWEKKSGVGWGGGGAEGNPIDKEEDDYNNPFT